LFALTHWENSFKHQSSLPTHFKTTCDPLPLHTNRRPSSFLHAAAVNAIRIDEPETSPRFFDTREPLLHGLNRQRKISVAQTPGKGGVEKQRKFHKTQTQAGGGGTWDRWPIEGVARGSQPVVPQSWCRGRGRSRTSRSVQVREDAGQTRRARRARRTRQRSTRRSGGRTQTAASSRAANTTGRTE